MTSADLDRLCGGTPQHTLGCPIADCDMSFGPYYDPRIPQAEVTRHLRALHSSLVTVTSERALDHQYPARHLPPTSTRTRRKQAQ